MCERAAYGQQLIGVCYNCCCSKVIDLSIFRVRLPMKIHIWHTHFQQILKKKCTTLSILLERLVAITGNPRPCSPSLFTSRRVMYTSNTGAYQADCFPAQGDRAKRPICCMLRSGCGVTPLYLFTFTSSMTLLVYSLGPSPSRVCPEAIESRNTRREDCNSAWWLLGQNARG